MLPFLHGERLAARVDLKADRKRGVLHVPAAHLEPGEPQDEVAFSRSPQQARFVSLDSDDFYAKVQTRLRLGV